jgi:hypothetical protein
MARAAVKRDAGRGRSAVASEAGPIAAPATAGAGKAMDAAVGSSMQWARDTLGASLATTQGMFSWFEALQQAQWRALQDAASDFGAALNAVEEAEDAAALAAVPAQLVQDQWRHAMDNASSVAARLVELESAWLQQAQRQAAERWTAWPYGTMSPSAPSAAQLQGDGADEAARQWQQWLTRWQEGVGEFSRAWNEAARSAQTHA